MTRSLQSTGMMGPLYTVSAHGLVDDGLIPATLAASSLQCMFGFFGSAAFRYSTGIAMFINDADSILQALTRTALQESDREAMRDPDRHDERLIR